MNSVGGHPTKAANRNLASRGLLNRRVKSFTCFRIPFMPREKAAYLKLRKIGLSINLIAQCFGRSTSVVHSALKRLLPRNPCIRDRSGRLLDMRKLPRSWKMINSAKRRVSMLKLQEAWGEWVSSEEGEPP